MCIRDSAKSDAHNLWERLKKHETAVLLFARLSHVPFTNNRAERDLQTMANQGYNPLVAIQMAFSGQLYADRGE